MVGNRSDLPTGRPEATRPNKSHTHGAATEAKGGLRRLFWEPKPNPHRALPVGTQLLRAERAKLAATRPVLYWGFRAHATKSDGMDPEVRNRASTE